MARSRRSGHDNFAARYISEVSKLYWTPPISVGVAMDEATFAQVVINPTFSKRTILSRQNAIATKIPTDVTILYKMVEVVAITVCVTK